MLKGHGRGLWAQIGPESFCSLVVFTLVCNLNAAKILAIDLLIVARSPFLELPSGLAL